ncbi:MAG TPA: serine protease [Bacteroidia bacterium]|nr:serine protease [Bacteroidia bacterium]
MKESEVFDLYLNGGLPAEDTRQFEQNLKNDAVLARAFEEHKALIASLELENSRLGLKNKLKSVHRELFGENTRILSIQKENSFARRHGKTIAVAASTALIAVLATVAALSTGGYLLKKQNNEILELKRNVMELKYSNEGIVEGITMKKSKPVYAPANLEGSAFALNNKGYVITSYHMVGSADSIFLQNEETERCHARLVFADQTIDLAVLKVDNSSVAKNWQVPYALKSKPGEIGESVFTLGFPREDVVYGEGALSALSGFSGDTSMYQISIPVNPGNSGGPVLDEQGNVIGVIKGKITGAEATGFAIRANQILQSLKNSAPDSLKTELLVQSNKKPVLRGLKRPEQIKRIHPYVFNVLVYKLD